MFSEKPSRSSLPLAKRQRYVPFTSADLVLRYEIALAKWIIKILLSDKLKFYFRLSIGPQTQYKPLYKRGGTMIAILTIPVLPSKYIE